MHATGHGDGTSQAVDHFSEGEHMAQRVQIVLEDDLDGSTAVETVYFGLDGVAYEIDLNSGNAERLREALAPWIGNARKVSGRKGGAVRRPRAAASSSSATEIRKWAQAQGMPVSSRGRVPAEIREAYEAAHR